LKADHPAGSFFLRLFPILGGRLLKTEPKLLMLITAVSNPWREAIEVSPADYNEVINMFPILGGRLLKAILYRNNRRERNSFQSLEGGY